MIVAGWLRLAVFALIVLTIAYWLAATYSRSVRREKLEKRWIAEEMIGDRDAWIEEGMRSYEKGLKRRLLWLIYILPMAFFFATVYFVNW